MAAKTIVDFANLIKDYTKKLVHWDERKGYVSKNLLPCYLSPQTLNNVNAIVNSDNSVTLDTNEGSASANTVLMYISETTDLKKIIPSLAGKEVKLTGGKNSNIRVQFWSTDTGVVADEGSGVTFTIPADIATKQYNICVRVASGTSISNETIYPMLRFSSITDSTYEPYLVPNTDLLSYTENSVLGAKNFMVQPYADPVTFSRGGITYTISEDGSIDAHGLATAEGQIDLHTNVKTPLTNLQTNTEYILSGAPAISNSTNDVRLQIVFKDNSTGRIDVICPQGGEVHFVIPTGYHFHWASIYVRNGQNLNHALFKPMIRLASDTDAIYTPYAMTNRDLTLKNTFYLLNSTNDLDDYVTDGQYYYESDRPANAPDTGNTIWAKVFVIGEGTPLQFVVSGSAMYTRRKGGGGNTWGNWYKYAGTELI